MLNSRLSLRIQESRPAAQSLTEKEEAVFEVTDVCTSWSLDFASDLFWIQAKPRTQLRITECPRNFRGDPLGQNTIVNSPAVQPCVRTEPGC